MKCLDSEYRLMPGRGQFRVGEREWTSDVDLGPEVRAALQHLELAPERYGELLFDRLFPVGIVLREGYRTAQGQAQARVEAGAQTLRFRLLLDEKLEKEVQDLDWELIRDHEDEEVLARSRRFAFSRFLAGREVEAVPGPPCVLIAVAAPPDVDRFRLQEFSSEEVLGPVVGACRRAHLACELLAPVTRAALGEKLRTGSYQALHLVAHGLPPSCEGAGLILQRKDGQAELATEDALVEILGGSRGLRLVVLAACHAGAIRNEGAGRGLAARLIQKGILAVIAMRRELSVPAANLFARDFYPSLAETGEVDVAVNRVRFQLQVESPGDGSSVVLFMSTRDGKVWPPPKPETNGRPRRIAVFVGIALLLLVTGGRMVSHLRPTSLPPIIKTSAPGAVSEEVRAKIAEAQRYRSVSGEVNTEKSFRLYREAFGMLSSSDLAGLDEGLVTKARDLTETSPADEGAGIYGQLLDRFAKPSATANPNLRRIDR